MDEQYVLDKLKTLMPGENAIPNAVLYPRLKTAVQKELAKCLNSLFKQDKIGYHKTLNGLSIFIK